MLNYAEKKLIIPLKPTRKCQSTIATLHTAYITVIVHSSPYGGKGLGCNKKDAQSTGEFGWLTPMNAIQC